MHRPSSAKLWQMPTPPTVLPTMPALPRRTVPLDEHDTSYLADSANTFSLWSTFSFIVRGDRVVGTKVMRIGWFRVGGRKFFCGETTIPEGDLDTLSRIFSTYYRGVFRVTWLMHLTIALPRARKDCVYRCQGVTFPPPTTYISAVTMDFSAVTMDFSALTMDFGKRE